MLIGSAMATSHCYMIYPAISMEGKLHSPMNILVSEARGVFPQNKSPDPWNIVSFASKTANMNKKDLKTFYQQVFWPSIEPSKILLLLDAWSPNKDDELFEQAKPPSKSCIRQIIPEGATGLVQPLDIYFFRPYKNFVKFFTDAVIDEQYIDIWSRENFIKLQSFTHFTFTAERFKSLIRFAFFKSNYTDEEPPKDPTPVEFCFSNLANQCERGVCSNLPFVR